jgi:PAS domain S-box-containing protein
MASALTSRVVDHLSSIASTPTRRGANWRAFAALPMLARLYVFATIGLGSVVFARAARQVDASPMLLLVLLASALLLSVFKVRLPMKQGGATMTLGYAPDFACLMLAGTDAAMVIAVAGVWSQCTFRTQTRVALHRALFSMASIAITIQMVGFVFEQFGGMPARTALSALALPLLAAATAYFLVNTCLVATAIALSNGASLKKVWHDNFLWSAPSYFLAAAVAVPAALAFLHAAYWAIPVTIAPLYLTYRSYQIYLKRIEDDDRHARELEALNDKTSAALQRAIHSERALSAETERLALERERLAVTLRNIGDGVITTDARGRILLMNDAAETITGLVQTEAPSRELRDVLAMSGLAPPVCQELLDDVLQRGVGGRCSAHPDNGARTIDSSGTPIRNHAGEIIGGVWVLRDVTDTLRLEEERAKAAKLESLGVLAGGLAHDFNNILTSVVGNISLARLATASENNEAAERLEDAEHACVRAKGITNQLLTFSKGGAPVKSSTSIATLVEDCATFALRGSTVAARFAIPADVWAADVDVGQMSQVVHNVVINAQQAMPAGGTIDITVENVELPAGNRERIALDPGRYVAISIADHGVGIPAAHLTKIFDPYFTTKQRGSGLGLATSYSIVARHGGVITVQSTVGTGTRCCVYLPASMRPIQPVAAAPPPAAARGGRVLIMDDEEAVRNVASRMFAKLGYDTAVARDGREAVEIFATAQRDHRPFDLVVLDLTVPGGVGGCATVPLLRDLDEQVKMVVSSGYADDPIMANYDQHGFCGVIRKPYVIQDIRDTLAQLVN